MVDDIYQELEKEIRKHLTGDETGGALKSKTAKIPKEILNKMKILVQENLQLNYTPIASEAIYCIFNKITSPINLTCPTCNCVHHPTDFRTLAKGYVIKKYCSRKCRSGNPDFKAARVAMSLEKYGTTCPLRNPEIINGVRKLWDEKYGVGVSPNQSQIVRDKCKATMLETYGVDHSFKLESRAETIRARFGVDHQMQNSEVMAKKKKTTLARFGVEHQMQNPNVVAKKKETMHARFGVDHQMQNPEVFAKQQSYKRKIGTWPSGMGYSYQGYEDVGINTLLDSGITEDHLVISTPQVIPTITYFNPVKNKDCRYFPDIFIPHENRLIEIKSEYTMGVDVEVNMAKHYASILNGFQHEIWVCSSTKVLEVIK